MRTPWCLASGVTPFSSFVLKPRITAPAAPAMITSFFVIRPTSVGDDLERHLRALDPLEQLPDGLGGPEDVGLDDHLEDLLLRRGDVGEEVLNGDVLLGGIDGRDLLLQALRLLLGELLRLPGVLGAPERGAASGGAGPADDPDRHRRGGLLDRVTLVVEHGAHLGPVGAADDGVARAQRSLLDDDRRKRAAAHVHLGLDDDSGDLRLGVRLELKDVGLQEDHFEKVVDPGPLDGRHRHRDRLPAPVLRCDAPLLHLRLHLVQVGALHVHLVHGDNLDHLGVARVLERLVRLGHEPVVGGDDQDRDVGHQAPRARILLNAAWPGVSRKVIFRPLCTTW